MEKKYSLFESAGLLRTCRINSVKNNNTGHKVVQIIFIMLHIEEHAQLSIQAFTRFTGRIAAFSVYSYNCAFASKQTPIKEEKPCNDGFATIQIPTREEKLICGPSIVLQRQL